MPATEIKNFESPDETREFEGNGHVDVVEVGDRTVTRGVFEPGWRWSDNVKPIAGTDSCQTFHLAYVISGAMRVMSDDGTVAEIHPGEVVSIEPGHDAETIGDEACVLVDFGHVTEYAKK